MAKSVIEEAALAGIPALILDPQGDLARLALGIDEKDLAEQGGEVDRMKKLISTMEVRIWTPLRSKGCLCVSTLSLTACRSRPRRGNHCVGHGCCWFQ